MQIKSFYGKWTDREIEEYLSAFNILILFETIISGQVIRIYADMSDTKKEKLENHITDTFGIPPFSGATCDKINEFAVKWYNKFVLGKTYRVINKS